MGSCDNWAFGKESDINKLADICAEVRQLLATKCGSKETGAFRDWTGISEFIICYDNLKHTLHGQKTDLFSDEEIEEEWTDCQPDKGEAAIYWMEIEWPHKVPSEIWAFMLQESKKLKIQELIENTIREWGLEDDKIFDYLEPKLGASEKL